MKLKMLVMLAAMLLRARPMRSTSTVTRMSRRARMAGS